MTIDYLELVDSCFCTNTRILARKVTRIYDSFLAPSGININQLSILLTIQGINQRSEQKDASARDIAEYLGMDTSSISRSLRSLEKQHIIDMVAPESNRRKKHIELTKHGEEVLMTAFPFWQEAQKEIRKQLGPENFSNMINLLTHITPEINQPLPSER